MNFRKDKSVLKRLMVNCVIILSLCFNFMSQNVFGQNSCQTAVTFSNTPPTQVTSFTGEVWVKFTAMTGQDGMRINPVTPQGALTPAMGNFIDTIQLYSGNCAALTSLKVVVRTPSTPSQLKYALVSGTDYYLRISFNNPIGFLTTTYFVVPTYPYGPSVCTSNCDLVCNGDFENTSLGYVLPVPANNSNIDYAVCYNTYFDPMAGWIDMRQDPGSGSPDYFNTQALTASTANGIYPMGVPNNCQGAESSLIGANAYAGIIALEVESPYISNPGNPGNRFDEFREYLQQQMCDSMITGRTYKVTFSASLSDSSAFATHLGILFKDDTLQQINQLRYSGAPPQWETPTKVTQTTGWSTFTFNYTASANHKHFAIGNFRTDTSRVQLNSNYVTIIDPSTNIVSQNSAFAYYYIDGISIVPVDSVLTISGTSSICAGGTASLVATIAGDTSGTQVWTSTPNDPALANFQDKAFAIVSPTQQTTYTCTVTDIYGCGTFTDTFTVYILPAPVANAGPDLSICSYIPVTVNGSSTGTTTQTSWSVVGSSTPLCTNCTSVTYTPSSTPTFLVYTAQNGSCIDRDTMMITVQNVPFPVTITPVLGMNANVLCAEVQYQVTGVPVGSTYQWTSSVPTSAIAPLFSVNWGAIANLASGSVSVTVTDPNGCFASASLSVTTPCCDTSMATGAGPIFVTNANVSQLLVKVAAVCPTCVVNNNIYFTGANQPRIAINGVLTIDQNLIIDGVDWINMGPNAAINVLVGKTLTLNNCTTETKCGKMWDGIYVTQPSSHVIITGGSLIQQAKNAIVSTNGGRYTCKNMKFDNCLKGIVVNTYPSTHPGIVNQSTFSMSGTFLPAIPALPTNYTKTLAGIEIDRVPSITIGDASQAILQNTFTGLFRGIYANASGTIIRNATFTNIIASTALPNSFYSGSAIYCQGQNGITWTQSVTVGGTAANQLCSFDNVRRGLLVILGHNVTFTGNKVNNLTSALIATGAGVSVNNCIARSITINNNRISNQNSTVGLPHAITLTDVGGSVVTINNNRLLQSSSTASSFAAQTGIGIRVQNTSAAPVDLKINLNDTIRRFQIGIIVTNVSNTTQGVVNRNGVYFDKPKANYNSGLHCGINFTNSTTLKADSNRVVRLSTPNWVSTDAPALATNLRGVFVTNSSACIISENTLTGMGDGIHGNGNCAGTYFVCNVLQNSYRAFMGTGTVSNSVLLPHQLNYNSTNYPTGNSFSGSAVSDLAGSIRLATNTALPINWYYSGVMPTTNLQLATGSLTNTNQPTLNNSQPPQCGSSVFRVPNSTEERDQLAGTQLALTEDTQASDAEQEIAAKDAHRLLLEHPDWLNLNTAQDQDYQDFFIVADSTDIGKSNYTEQATIVEDTTGAIVYNTAVSGNTYPAWYHKVVYEIYNRTWLVGNMELSSSDTAILLPIALMHPSVGGEAVYTARVMLGIIMDDATGNYNSRMLDSEDNSEIQTSVIVRPNPASSQVFVTGVIEKNAVVLFTLYDLSGRIVLSKTMNTADPILVIDIEDITAGAYLYSLRVNGNIISEERLIIAR